MNREWMRERLESYQALCEEYLDEYSAAGSNSSPALRPIRGQMVFQTPTVRKILKSLDPALAGEVHEPEFETWVKKALFAVQQGLGMLRDMDQWAVNLAPDAPSVVGDQFHPHVWTAAAALWDTGQYRVAVGQATVSLSAHIAKKAGSPLTERELVAQVFSPNQPGPNQPRLHLPGDKLGKTWRSRQEGLHLVAQGAFAGIRNVVVHAEGEWSEQWRWSTLPSSQCWPDGPTRPRSSPARSAEVADATRTGRPPWPARSLH